VIRRSALALLALGGTAHAGGLGRPNGGSPEAGGLGGAFTAVADDATCVQVNPAGCAFAPLSVLAALELVVAPRSYVPIDASGTEGDPQDATAIAPAPILGVLVRPGSASDLTVGIVASNTFGGILSWDALEGSPMPSQITESTDVVFELAAGGGYAINDRVSVGASVRVGLGLFAVHAYQMAGADETDISSSGVGVGAAAGLTICASDALTIAAGWRSNLDVSTSGSATIVAFNTRDVDVEHTQHWPQSASLSLALQPGDRRLLLAAQLDWTQWSRFETLDIVFPGNTSLDQHIDLDWSDTLAARVGLAYRVSDGVALRVGGLYDGNAVPDRTIDRQYLDAPKFGAAAGASFRLSSRTVLDLALHAVGGPKRTVDDNSTEVPSWDAQQNVAPGEHSGSVLTFATGVRIAL